MSSNPAPSTSVTTPNPHSSTSLPTAATFAAHSSSNSLPPTPPAAPSENQFTQEPDASVSLGPNHLQGVDPQIVEALRSKDRLFVLKLGETMESLIKDRSSRSRMDLSPSTSYQRLLIHRCSAYYKLTPETNPVTRGIAVVATIESRIPSRRICELVPAEASSPPAIKIMRRSMQERRSKPQSNSGSIAGEEADLSDGEPSESGSQRGKGDASSIANEKKRLTLKEREAAYSKARSRIFMDFEEKEKEKEKDMSASSSSLSLASGSTNGGSVGDIDDSASSPATESEWSAPSGRVTREKDLKDSRGNISASSSSKSLRSSAQSYNPNGSGSSHNSRASSPSFTYATIYEPHQGPGYDQSQHFPPTGYQSAPYAYHYPPGQPSNPYMPQYPYYPPYNAYHSTPSYNPQSISDPTTPGGADMYSTAPHPATYGHPYGWHHPPVQSAPPMQHPSHQISPPPPQATTHHTGPPLHGPPYHPYVPTTPVYTYPIPGYYAPLPGHNMEPLTPVMAPQGAFDVSRTSNGSTNGSFVPASVPDHSTANGAVGPASNGRTPRHANSLGGLGNGKGRGGAPGNQMRSPWSYGPGISGYGNGPTGRGEAVGPRLSTTRRQSSNSNGTGTSRSSTSDDVSSTASSSTTSSSSRRTYTSTTSSQHPLPARPDWAVGLKPQPTLHPTLPRHHDHSLTNSRTMSPISPSRSLNGNNADNHASPQPPPISFQSTDFPPLTSVAGGPGKRAPVNTGAWANPSSTRSIRIPNTAQPNALVHHPTNNASSNGALPDSRFEEQDRDFERPPPKSAELYNPKLVRRSTGAKFQIEKEKEQGKGDTPCGATLVGQVASMTLESREDDALVQASVVESLQ